MSNDKIIKVAVIDSSTTLRYMSLKQLINSGFTIHFQADNGQQAIERIASSGLPDVCVIEENFEANSLMVKLPDLKVLISSTKDDVKSVTDMLKKGVSGYILKYADPDELVTAVTALSKGKKYFSLGVAEIVQEYFGRN